jgi:hypothetical protein
LPVYNRLLTVDCRLLTTDNFNFQLLFGLQNQQHKKSPQSESFFYHNYFQLLFLCPDSCLGCC